MYDNDCTKDIKKIMADVGHHMFTKSVFYTLPLTEKKHKRISSINCFYDDLT